MEWDHNAAQHASTQLGDAASLLRTPTSDLQPFRGVVHKIDDGTSFKDNSQSNETRVESWENLTPLDFVIYRPKSNVEETMAQENSPWNPLQSRLSIQPALKESAKINQNSAQNTDLIQTSHYPGAVFWTNHEFL